MLPNTVLTKATRRPRPLKLYPGHKISKRYMRARLNRRVLNSLKRVVPNIAGKKNVTECTQYNLMEFFNCTFITCQIKKLSSGAIQTDLRTGRFYERGFHVR
ncbi:hypothetical protein HELRODRAFT_162512 [Helobdella robusta]|uniref:Uncharacterized protein n=1 Tax=Helobdella robusta TaxID=6412 RepID=T1ESS2_HELRO|nr:hypothetical protein HELRODRAFT_162512 [Helobdella robusta]ESN99034.1 hypothetical protein HELRODRAFT_162512 [Helobdella robusta]